MSFPRLQVLPEGVHPFTRGTAGAQGALHVRARRHRVRGAADHSSVLTVEPDAVHQLHTTRTPEFLRLWSPSAETGIHVNSDGASNVVIGVIDTGVYPMDRPSFAADPLLPPPPSKFNGDCVSLAPSKDCAARVLQQQACGCQVGK